MKLGKVPPQLLERLLAQVAIKDPRVLLGPKLGEDAALIDYGDKVLVAKTDPITFATNLIGWYAVQVNANDVACSGAQPRWFLATLLLPQAFTEKQVSSVFDQVNQACDSLGVTLVGGHSEITQGLAHPIVIGCMLGEVEKGKVVKTAGAQVGDRLVVTKGIALEGSALLARERAQELRDAGVSQASIARAAEFLFSPGISVVKEALAACSAATVHSLHDPTEGGLATGLLEIARVAGLGMVIKEEEVPVVPQCRVICDALGLDPLGLLASGCLVIALPQVEVPKLLKALKREGIKAWEIGHTVEKEKGVLLDGPQGIRPMPTFERDELARYLEG
jgi:hydrogenase maturation factor